MANRLPTPGSDTNQWGQILNDFLAVSHASDGSLNPIPQSLVTNLTSDLAAKETPAGAQAKATQAKAEAIADTATKYTKVFVWNGTNYGTDATVARTAPAEFRGPTDPATISGVVVNQWDAWDNSV